MVVETLLCRTSFFCCTPTPLYLLLHQPDTAARSALPHLSCSLRRCGRFCSTAGILRLTEVHQHIYVTVSADGIRAANGIVAFWTIAELQMAFSSPGNQQGSWVFRVILGKPAQFHLVVEQSLATRAWVFMWGEDEEEFPMRLGLRY